MHWAERRARCGPAAAARPRPGLSTWPPAPVVLYGARLCTTGQVSLVAAAVSVRLRGRSPWTGDVLRQPYLVHVLLSAAGVGGVIWAPEGQLQPLAFAGTGAARPGARGWAGGGAYGLGGGPRFYALLLAAAAPFGRRFTLYWQAPRTALAEFSSLWVQPGAAA